jgi:hypothetical protein
MQQRAEQSSSTRQLAQRLGKLSPTYWVVSLSILGGTVASICVGALAKDAGVAKIFQTAVTPILTLFAGGVLNDYFYRLGEDRQLTSDVKKSADATLIMLQNVLSVERWLGGASNHLNEGNPEGATTSIQVALEMTKVTLRQVFQNLRLWRDLSPQAVDRAKTEFQEDETQPAREQIPTRNDDTREDGNG